MDPIVINIEEFTKNVQTTPQFTVTGEGIFDTLMDTATKHITAQYQASRIRGEDYATAYIQIYQTTLQAALQIWLQKGIAEAQLKLLEKQIDAEDAKKDLYQRQIQGLDEDYKYKVLKACLDSWAVGFSVAKDSFQSTGIPVPMTSTAINSLYNTFIVPELDQFPDFRNNP